MSQPDNLRDLFEAALALAPGARVEYLASHCSDEEQRRAVERLLAADVDATPRMLDGPLDALLERVGETDVDSALPPQGAAIGPFTVLDRLGEGGSSVVFRAEREQAGVTQCVALKLLRRGIYSAEEQRQFRRERLALAQLRHPGIARLIEGGVTAQGIPYIALELVDGVPITDYVRNRQLDLRRRLALFVAVCRAVEAAHRALIVHRDLKPSNVLVTADGEVKLLDFGIAKLLDADDDGTRTVQRAMTPAYAAPEQFTHGAITTATDVYALGVLLGELITGSRREHGDARTPSSRITDDEAPGALPATPAATRRQLRGDLDNIVMKATALEPQRRYASAGAFADDIERHLAGRPVAAHPPSPWYRAGKFVARHKGGVLATTAFLLAIFAALGIAVWQARLARQQAEVAAEQARRANATRDFLLGLFDAAKADLPRNQRPTPDALVQEAVKRLHADAALSAESRTDLLLALSKVSTSLGDYAQALTLAGEAAALTTTTGNAAQRLEAEVGKATIEQKTNRSTDAETRLAAALPELRRVETSTAVDGLMLYATVRIDSGHFDDGIGVAKEAAAKAARIRPADSLEAVKAAVFPGEIMMVARRDRDALLALEPAVRRWRALGLPQDKDFAQALMALADARERSGDLAGTEAAHRESVALLRRIYDRPHDNLAVELEDFAAFLIKRERYDEAGKLLEEALAIDRQVLGPDSLETASTLDDLGTLEGSRRSFEASERYLRDALAIYDAHVAEAGHAQDRAITRSHYATTLDNLGQFERAQREAEQTLAALRELHGDVHQLVAGAMSLVARVTLHRGDPNTALSISTRALDVLAQLAPPAPRMEILDRQVRALALEALGRRDEALDDAAIAIALSKSAAPDAHAKRASLLALQARLQRALGRTEAASGSVVEARALKVPPQLLSAEDQATLVSH